MDMPVITVPQADPGAAYRAQQPAIDAALQRALSSGWYILGAEGAAFEREFAEWLGLPRAVGCANGTDALLLILRAWDVGPGETASIPTKWISSDGLQVHLVFSGDDCFSVRRGTLSVAR